MLQPFGVDQVVPAEARRPRGAGGIRAHLAAPGFGSLAELVGSARLRPSLATRLDLLQCVDDLVQISILAAMEDDVI